MIANLDEIDEISSTSRSIPESRESRRRRPSPVAAGGLVTVIEHQQLVAPQQLHRPSRLHPIRAHQVGIVLLYSINAITTVPLEV
ncbi:unnamed protein product, partial [Rotaria sordida]